MFDFLNREQRCRIGPVFFQMERKINQHQQQHCVSHRGSSMLPQFLYCMKFAEVVARRYSIK